VHGFCLFAGGDTPISKSVHINQSNGLQLHKGTFSVTSDKALKMQVFYEVKQLRTCNLRQ